MSIFKIWKEAKRMIKEQEKLLASQRRIEKSSLDYDMLQNLVNATANSVNPIEMELNMADGSHITLRPMKDKITYTSFRDRFNELHSK